jgi:hypothetical protein
VRLEILALVGLQLVEPSDAGFHLLGSERFCSHGGSPNSRVVRIGVSKPMTRVTELDLVYPAPIAIIELA